MYDIVIRNGDVVDGTGLPRYRADVALKEGRIAAIGRHLDRGREEIDAEGHVVTPGFIDGHTHMDAQIFWDKLGSCSCWHGVTTVVMGNCGFTLAPASKERSALVVRNLERSEDISAAAMAAGITWTWTRFSEYLDTIDRLPKGINYAAQIGHSALRTYVMGERAFDQAELLPGDLDAMQVELNDALQAGAIGFSTSRLKNHVTPDERPVASRLASWQELEQLVGVVSRAGHGVFSIAQDADVRSPDPDKRRLANQKLADLAIESRVPVTFGVVPVPGWRDSIDMIDRVARAGGRMFAQTHPRGISHIVSFKTRLHFDVLPEWQPIRALPLDEQRRHYLDPQTRRRLVEATDNGKYATGGGRPREPNYGLMHLVGPGLRNPTVAELAAQRGMHPVDLIIQLALDTDFDQMFAQFLPENQSAGESDVIELLKHPRSILTFSDSGAHVSYVMDSSIQTYMLAYWVRERQVFTLEEAVRSMTLAPAIAWGFRDRGLLREGCNADINIIDPERIAPDVPVLVADLPAGAKRLKQKSLGLLATIVGGAVYLRNGEHSGALNGRLLRSRIGGAA
jgi:N-acyl-D-aspartate/D-glutamate deacylase